MRIGTGLFLLALFGVTFLWLTGGGAVWTGGAPAADEELYRGDGRYVGPALEARPRPNLIVIVLDTLRADCLGAAGSDAPGDMPYLGRLASLGVRCTNVTAPAPATYPSMASLLTGLLPDEHGVDHTPNPPRLPAGITTFAEALSRGHDYETAAFLQVRLSNAPNGILQGFSTARSAAPLHAWRASIEDWNRTRKQARPFFLLLHTYEAHDPYGEENRPWPEPPVTEEDRRIAASFQGSEAQLVEAFLTNRGVRMALLQQGPRLVFDRVFDYYGRGFAANPDPALAERLEAAYRRGVRWVDRQLEASVAHLRAQGLLENTLLVVTSDHGEAFGEHGLVNHGRGLHGELVRVPLVAVGPPPFDGGRTVGTSMGLVDLLPSFFELAGLPPPQGIEGRSMLGAISRNEPGRAVLSLEDLSPFKMGRYTNVKLASARTATESYIIRYDVPAGTYREELYDLVEDPGERTDLAASTGRVGDLPVSAALAAAIESVRDRIWTSVDSSQDFMQMGYGSGVAAMSETRPTPPRVR